MTKHKPTSHDGNQASAPDMSIGDTARYLGVNPDTVRVMIADGRLKAYRLGERIIRLRRSEIDAAMQLIGEQGRRLAHSRNLKTKSVAPQMNSAPKI